MCGIFGFIGKKPDHDRLSEAAKGASRRGPHAHGIAWRHGDDMKIEKFAGPLQDTSLDLARGSRIVVGHCRLATTGVTSYASLDDAQPLQTGPFIVAHNGVVPASRYRHLVPDMKTKNDSEAIPIAWSRGTTGSDRESLEQVIEELLHGAPFAIVATNGTSLFVAHRHLPLRVSYHDDGVYVSSFPVSGDSPLDPDHLHVFSKGLG